MRHANTIPAALACLMLAGCGNSVPLVEVETNDTFNLFWGTPYVEVKVKSLVEKIRVEDIRVNRGNCKPENVTVFNRHPIIPKTLRFGEVLTLNFSGPCEASQVDVTTDQGSWSFSY